MLMIKQLLIAYLIPVFILLTGMSAGGAGSFIWLVEPQFESAGIFSEGMAAVKVGGKYGFINTTGEMIIEPRFDEAGNFSEGSAVVYTGGFPGHVNRKGLRVIVLREDESRYFGDGLAVIKIKDRYGYIKSSGGMALQPVYEDAFSFSEGLAPVKIDGRYGFINKTGKVIIKPVYEKAAIFSEGLAAVMINGKWGYINRRGRMVVKAVYSDAGEFMNGCAPVKSDAGFGYIDRKGRLIVKPQFEEALPFTEKIAAVKLDGRWGYIKLRYITKKKKAGKTPYGKIVKKGKGDSEAITEKTGGKSGRDIIVKTSVNKESESAGKTLDKGSGKISVSRDSADITEKAVKKGYDEYKSGKASVKTETGSGDILYKKERAGAGKESEYTPAFDYSESKKEIKSDENIPVIKGMKYVGTLSEVNSGQVIIIDSKTGRKVYLGAWCITGVEEDRIYLEAGTPFSTIAKCDFLNGFYEKIKPGMKVYKKIK